jgi:hypothetical protein
MNYVQLALNEIGAHNKVSGYRLLNNEEIEICFNENYRDLIIPITPKMNNDNLLTVFYYYVANYKGK